MTDPAIGGEYTPPPPAEGEEPQKAYEITATDHINKSMLDSFKGHLENKTVKVPENDEKDQGDWDD